MESVRPQAYLDEVVEDSEPERQELWRREKEEKRKGRKLQSKVSVEVIDLSDRESVGQCLAAREERDVTVISISDGSVKSHFFANPRTELSPYCSSATTSTSNDSSSLSLDLQKHLTNPAKPSEPISITDDDESEDETSSKFRSGIGQFAFSTNHPSSNPPVPKKRATTPALPPPKKPARTKHASTSLLDFSDSQLTALRKCVSCDIKWTTRKSVAQKITHIASCAKKSFITDDTLKVLLVREIGTIQSETSKAQPLQKDLGPPKSFIEDILADGGIRRIARKKKTVASSLLPVTDSRESIVKNAMALLGGQESMQSTSTAAVMQPPPSTQAFGSSKLASGFAGPLHSDDPPAATQVFGRSNLGSVLGYSSSIREDPSDIEVDSLEGPPATQAFATSRFTSLGRGRSLFDQELSDNPDILDYHDNVFRSPPVIDDAILVYEPDLNPLQTSTPTRHQDTVFDPMTPTSKTNVTRISPKKVRKPKSKGKGKEPQATESIEDDEELSNRLKAMVLANDELHLRILRYEPIQFDIFMMMAKDQGVHAVGLKAKMRTFLDTQAISHYGSEPGGSRNRH